MPVIKIGPTYNSLQQYKVNDDKHPLFVNSSHFTGYITVRLQNHHHKNDPVTKSCSYFENRRRFFSFQFQGRFKPTNPNRDDHLWTFDDILFCAETESSINPPMGSSLAVRFAGYIDPGFNADGMFLKKRPWVGSWLICGMNVVKVWKAESDNISMRKVTKSQIHHSSPVPTFENNASPLLPIEPWVYYGKHNIEEDTKVILPEENFNSSKRRNYFSQQSNRKDYVFNPSHIYCCDFFNNFTNFSTMNADMIIKFSMSNVLRNQPLRFVCRNRGGDAIFFVIEIDYSDLLK
ncbi:6617_t:CDS:1 [Funneliformis geosporum]|uniref:11834_t:CDS:1 n=1 Tax=Funneliformis geosporum TaxID=1117311 RepID=A0A9W4SLS9_9GLOM|nr:11834_t:CDS:1 [Funneliformis geosporum]CAI2182783.1 6617_t:CDS:1 [Funneliformis geosporum]